MTFLVNLWIINGNSHSLHDSAEISDSDVTTVEQATRAALKEGIAAGLENLYIEIDACREVDQDDDWTNVYKGAADEAYAFFEVGQVETSK